MCVCVCVCALLLLCCDWPAVSGRYVPSGPATSASRGTRWDSANSDILLISRGTGKVTFDRPPHITGFMKTPAVPSASAASLSSSPSEELEKEDRRGEGRRDGGGRRRRKEEGLDEREIGRGTVGAPVGDLKGDRLTESYSVPGEISSVGP